MNSEPFIVVAADLRHLEQLRWAVLKIQEEQISAEKDAAEEENVKRRRDEEYFELTDNNSVALIRLSTSISKQQCKKLRNWSESFSGSWICGVPFVAIKYKA